MSIIQNQTKISLDKLINTDFIMNSMDLESIFDRVLKYIELFFLFDVKSFNSL